MNTFPTTIPISIDPSDTQISVFVNGKEFLRDTLCVDSTDGYRTAYKLEHGTTPTNEQLISFILITALNHHLK